MTTLKAIIIPEGRSSPTERLDVADMLYLAELLDAPLIDLTEYNGYYISTNSKSEAKRIITQTEGK